MLYSVRLQTRRRPYGTNLVRMDLGAAAAVPMRRRDATSAAWRCVRCSLHIMAMTHKPRHRSAANLDKPSPAHTADKLDKRQIQLADAPRRRCQHQLVIYASPTAGQRSTAQSKPLSDAFNRVSFDEICKCGSLVQVVVLAVTGHFLLTTPFGCKTIWFRFRGELCVRVFFRLPSAEDHPETRRASIGQQNHRDGID